MTIGRKVLIRAAAFVVLLFVVSVPFGDHNHGFGKHSQAMADIGQTLWVAALIAAAGLVTLAVVAAAQLAKRSRRTL